MRNNNPLSTQFIAAEYHINQVASGAMVCCAIAGAPGIGKSHKVSEILKSKGTKAVYVNGSSAGLMEELYTHRHPGNVIVLDDADSLVTGGTTLHLNMMKALLAPDLGGREIINVTKEALKNERSDDPDPNIPPTRFRTHAGVIWLTNLDLNNLAQFPKGKRSHIEALKSRLRIATLSKNPDDLLDYIVTLACKDNVINRVEVIDSLTGRVKLDLVQLRIQNEALEYYVEMAEYVDEISVRRLKMFVETCHHRREIYDDWKDLVSQFISRVKLRTITTPYFPEIIPHRHMDANYWALFLPENITDNHPL